jgi:hypothetical protein
MVIPVVPVIQLFQLSGQSDFEVILVISGFQVLLIISDNTVIGAANSFF